MNYDTDDFVIVIIMRFLCMDILLFVHSCELAAPATSME